MNFKNNVLPLGRRGDIFLLTYDEGSMQGVGGKNHIWAPIVTKQNTLFCIQSWHKPTEISRFYYKMFSMKINQKLHTRSNNFYTLCGLMNFKLRLRLDATILFQRKCASCTCDGKNATNPAQIVASLIQGREHKGKWTSFHLLPDLCPLHF